MNQLRLFLMSILLAGTSLLAQPGDCVVNILNRSAAVGPDGRWRLDSVPANQGAVRARFTCTTNGATQYGQSPFFQVLPGQTAAFPSGIPLGNYLIPSSLRLTAPSSTLNGPGATTQASAVVTFQDSSLSDVSAAAASISYFTSNPQIATISPNGLITATGAGSVIVTALYDGVSAFLPIDVVPSGDSDGDGIPDSSELALGLLPNNPTDALEDLDGDGLTNLDEFRLSSDIRNPDTDGDGIPDGLEVRLGLNIRVADPTTSVAGRVTDGANAGLAGVEVRVFNSITSSTDANGNYLLRFVPAGLGSLTIQALLRSPVFLAGSTTGLNPVSPGTTNAPVIVLSTDRGTVTGIITNPQGIVVPGSAVTLQTGILSVGGTTDAAGRYRFEGVPAGNVSLTALDLTSGARGTNSALLVPNTTLTVNLPLALSGAVAGTVLSAGANAPVARARVSLTAGSSVLTGLTDTLGRYRFEIVPVGAFTVEADLEGDRGRSTGILAAAATTATAEIRLSGLGSVAITALQSGTPVSGVQVRLTNTSLGVTYDATTAADGLASFPRVLAGAFTVLGTRASPAQTQNASGTLALNGSVSLSLVFDPGAGGASVSGRVLQTNSSSPIPGAQVGLRSRATNAITSTQNAGPDGTYRFDALPIGSYSVEYRDGTTQRAREVFAINSATDAVVRDLIAVATGTIRGTVRNTDNSASAGQTVMLQSQHPSVGGFFSATTAADGTYTVAGVPAAPIRASVFDAVRLVSGESIASVAADSTTTADISLQANTVALPVSLWDANNRLFDIQFDGRIGRGESLNQNGLDAFGQTSRLELIVAGNTGFFNGANNARAEFGGRQLAISQAGLAGLNVVRKIFVPRDGYFARYVESIHNPNAISLTITARVRYPLPLVGIYRTQPGQSGSATPNIADVANPDRWVAANDLFLSLPVRGLAFDGGQARVRATSAVADSTGVTIEWGNLTVPAGATVGLMHFLAQHPDFESSSAVLQHLTRMPPEALAGLSSAEIVQIQNFAIHPDGVSDLAPQPLLDGSINTTVLDWSGTIPVASTRVDFVSNSLFYNRTQSAVTSNTGAVSLTSSFTANGTSIVIPKSAYRFRVTNPLLQGVAGNEIAEFPGTFNGTLTTTPAQLRLTGTGNIAGSLNFPSGSVPLFRTLRINGALANTLPLNGPFTLPAIVAGTATLDINAGHPQGQATSVIRSIPVVVRAGETANVNLYPSLGSIAGRVSLAGAPVANVTVRAAFQNTIRQTLTDAAGNYVLNDLDIAEYPLSAELGNLRSSAQTAVVLPGQQVTRNLELQNPGSVDVRVILPPSTPVAGATVVGGGLSQVSGADGRTLFTNLPGLPLTFSVGHPTFDLLEASGTATPSSPSASLDLVFPQTGAVSGIATRASGALLVNAQVLAGCGSRNSEATTNAQGRYTISMVPLGRTCSVSLNAVSPQLSVTSPAFQIPASGATITQDLRLLAVATVQVTFRNSANQPLAGETVFLTYTRNGQVIEFAGGTNAAGIATFSNIPEGQISIRAITQQGPGPGVAVSSVTIRPADDSSTVAVTVTLGSPGSVRGTVYAGDGLTPLPFVAVDVYDLATGESVVSTESSGNCGWKICTDENGTFDSGPVNVSSLGFRVAVVTPQGEGVPTILVSDTGVFTSPNQIVTKNLTAPLSIVRGTVYRDDGASPVPGVSVFITQGASVFFATTDDFGRYSSFGVPTGPFSVNVQNGLLFGEAAATLNAIIQPAIVNLTLPASATLQGTVRNSAGQPVASAIVGIGFRDPSFTGSTLTASDGTYIQSEVPLGNVFVEAQDPVSLVSGLATTTLSVSNETRQLDLALEATGSLAGQARQSASLPLSNASLRMESLEIGPLGGVRRYANADSSGNFSFVGFPAGPVRTLATNVNDSSQAGFADTTLLGGQLAVVNPQTGNTVLLGQANLDGTDGFRYGLGCGGALAEGGTVNRRLQDPFQAFLQAPGAGCQDLARPSLDGRQLEFGPQFSRGLALSRRVFVPNSGKFARYLDSFTNTTSLATTVEFTSSGSFNSWVSTSRLVTDPNTNGRTYAITDDPGACCTPSLGVVIGGPAARTSPLDMRFPQTGQSTNTDFAYRWRLTVPPGQTVSILQFIVQRDRLDTTGAIAQAQSLVSLTDPEALTGLSAADRAQVYNFNIP